MMILEAHQLKKSYRAQGGRSVAAVRDVSLHIAAGEVLAFLGPNGAGKTTTIKMIAGLIQPDEGSVRIVNRNPHRQPEALRQLGAVLEGNRNIYWRLTPQENLEYFGVLRGLPAPVARSRSLSLLDRFDLMHKRHALTQSLSRGMQQKLAIAVALIHQPSLLLLDEPTLGLDVEATEDVKQIVREIAQDGCAILLTTHQLLIAEELSNRVAIIYQGQIVVEETADALVRQFASSAYVVETEHAIDADRLSKLLELGISPETDRMLRVADQALLYPILDLLRPLPLLRVERDQASLTDVFLKLVREQRHD